MESKGSRNTAETGRLEILGRLRKQGILGRLSRLDTLQNLKKLRSGKILRRLGRMGRFLIQGRLR